MGDVTIRDLPDATVVDETDSIEITHDPAGAAVSQEASLAQVVAAAGSTIDGGEGIDATYDTPTKTWLLSADPSEFTGAGGKIVPVVAGGTGAGDAPTARTNLGLLAGGWYEDPTAWVFGTAGSGSVGAIFGVPTTDVRPWLDIGTKISWNDGSVKYGYIAATLHNSAVVTGVSGDPTTDTFTKTAHGYDVLAAFFTNVPVTITSGLANLTGLAVGTVYWIVVATVTANTFQLSTLPGGAAINLGGTTDAAVAFGAASKITLMPMTDYTVTNAAITARRYSYADSPIGFPTWFHYTPTLSGWSVAPTGTLYGYSCQGHTITLNILQGAGGTSNNATHTITLPITSATAAGMTYTNPAFAVDNNVTQIGLFRVGSAATVLTCMGILATQTNTNSGTSRISGQVTYRI